MTLREAILKRLDREERTQAWLARRIGVTTTEMSHIIREQNFPSPPVLNKILKELHIKMTFELED